VLFPVASSTAQKFEVEPLPVERWRGAGTVLVVDDDEGVRDIAKESLERAGLSVLTARDGREGVETFRQFADEIRVVFLDRTMPDISGEQAFEEIRLIRPTARIVLVSGYSEERAARPFADKELAGFLQKPFRPQTLLETARFAIEG
jgi:DNA-binding NtrC family response regulator